MACYRVLYYITLFYNGTTDHTQAQVTDVKCRLAASLAPMAHGSAMITAYKISLVRYRTPL